MSSERQRLGKRGEELARHRLEARGYRVLKSNYRTKSGEIDLIAEEGGFLVFVEVRTRTGTSFGSPEESITPKKRATMIAAAEEYMQENGLRAASGGSISSPSSSGRGASCASTCCGTR